MRRLVLVATLATLAACGGGGIPIDELADELINTVCDRYAACGYVDDVATCRKLVGDGEVNRDLIAAVEAGTVIYHAGKARDCLDAVDNGCQRGGQVDTTACEEVFEGTVGAGGQCAMDEQCVSQNCDVPDCAEACCQGTCVGDTRPVRPRLGQACDLEGESCLNSFCDPATNTCTAYRAAGESCTGSSQCATGVCSGQVCVVLPGPGEPCSPQLGFGLCNHIGYTCSPSTMTCVPYGLLGDPCTVESECSPLYDCGEGGTCELGPTLGESCAGPNGTVSCVDASYCDQATMTCTARKPDGAACDTNSQCTSRYCDGVTSTCTTLPVCI